MPNTRLMWKRAFGLGCLATLLWPALAAHAAPVTTQTWRGEVNQAAEFCVLGTFDSTSYTVFGTPVNLGVQAVGFFCTGVPNGATFTGHCDARPDPNQWSFDFSVPAPPAVPVGQPIPFVGDATNVAGTIAAALGNLTYTIDGVEVQRQVGSQSPTISGCLIQGPVDIFDGHGGMNAFQTTATGTGTNVAVTTTATYTDPNTGNQTAANVDITFDNITSGGATLVTATSSAAGDLTSNFEVSVAGYQATFIDVSTTATFSANITICQHYNDTNNDGFVDGTGVPETSLRFLHNEAGVFVDRTISQDTVNNIICAQVTSLSPFVIGVDVATQSTHDGVVLPHAPVKVTIPKKKTAVVKKLSVKVLNADLSETAGHTAKLSITASTCPASVLLDAQSQPVLPDFDPHAGGAQDSILVIGGKTATAQVPLTIKSDKFASPNAQSPARCTITFTTTTVAAGTVIDPNGSNNSAQVEIDVIDKNDF
jgi:hypothetical protein